MKVLLTGFEPDEAVPVNTSFEVLKRLPEAIGSLEIVTDQLRCDYRAPMSVVEALAEKHHPDVFICMGQALRREVISLEKAAINYQHDDRELPMSGDYYGFAPKHRAVVEGGPDVYFTNLPIQRMLKAMQQADYPCEISLTAGAVGCNNAMYSVLHMIHSQYPHMMGGFIHVPGHHEHPKRIRKTYDLDYIAHGVETALSVLDL
jgi:pyroglutamyl-peptidase